MRIKLILKQFSDLIQNQTFQADQPHCTPLRAVALVTSSSREKENIIKITISIFSLKLYKTYWNMGGGVLNLVYIKADWQYKINYLHTTFEFPAQYF